MLADRERFREHPQPTELARDDYEVGGVLDKELSPKAVCTPNPALGKLARRACRQVPGRAVRARATPAANSRCDKGAGRQFIRADLNLP